MRTIVGLASLFTVCSLLSYAQFLPDLQAKTPAEYDAYLDVLDGPVIPRAEAFVRDFPDSALRLPVWELLAKARRAEGNAPAALHAASSGLALAPEYVPLLVEVADLMANTGSEWPGAQRPAQTALEILGRAKAPLRVRPEQWTEAVGTLRAKARAALGIVKFKQNDLGGAVREFEAALRETPAADPALHYRLGRLYAATGRSPEARTHLGEAARTGSAELRTLARQALAELP